MAFDRPCFSFLAAWLLAAMATGAIPSNGTEPASDLVGLWHARRHFGPEVRGTLDIVDRSGDLTAHIAGYATPMSTNDGAIAFEITGDRGKFRGRILTEGDTIRGHWIQPPTAANGIRLASPVTLTRRAAGHWRGEVVPLDDKMTFFLRLLAPKENGSIEAFLRNPEANFGRHFRIEQVLHNGDRILFIESDMSEPRLVGTFRPDHDTISIFIPDAGGTFDFHRVTEDAASPFYARGRDAEPYVYYPPTARNDGWETGSLDEVGMAVSPIEEMIQLIIDTPINSIDAPYIHAVLIARKGKLVVEEYFHGHTADTPHDTRSASKTVTSTLIGLAIQAGEPLNVSSLVYPIMYDGIPSGDIDPRKMRMTLEDLLTMSPGLACDDNDEDSPGNEWRMQTQPDPDWLRYTLELPMIHEPGEFVAYCSASTNLAAGVLRKATGTWLPVLYERYFARPMQMGIYHMNLMPTGEAYGGGGLYVTGRDFLKMGQIFLDNGMWGGNKLLGDEWLESALKPTRRMFEQGYGYAWWIIDLPYKNRTVQAFYAGGNGGQYVMGIPEFEICIVFFGGNYNHAVTHLIKKKHVPEYILRSVADE